MGESGEGGGHRTAVASSGAGRAGAEKEGPDADAIRAAEVNAILAVEPVKARLGDLGLEPVASSSPEAFRAHIAAELPRWEKIVRAAGVRLD
jgi:tripartite-type tricarboxylate transporter receptor subunit TctC